MNSDIFDKNGAGPGGAGEAADSLQDAMFADVDKLFSQSRSNEPIIADDNFTKIVVNSLPARVKRSQSRSYLFDILGLILGVFAAYLFFDLGQFTQSALAIIPESLSLTLASAVANLVILFGAAIAISVVGWWAAEKALN